MGGFQLVIITEVNDFIDNLSVDDQVSIKGNLVVLENRNFDSIYVRWLTKELRELKVRKYRLIFFVHKNTVYVVRVFVKKTQKTPKNEIKMAERYYKFFTT